MKATYAEHYKAYHCIPFTVIPNALSNPTLLAQYCKVRRYSANLRPNCVTFPIFNYSADVLLRSFWSWLIASEVTMKASKSTTLIVVRNQG
jgi:hypothetical protein